MMEKKLLKEMCYLQSIMMVANSDSENSKGEKYPIQTPGYFRCEYCNDAEEWKMPNEFLLVGTGCTLS